MRPNFLIVGAAKSGTTSLAEYLRQHPEIFLPEWKELSFFCEDPYGPLHKVKKSHYYDKVFANALHYAAVGEASTSYLFDAAAPKLIKEALGTIKIIIVLRDPVAMSYSLYNHQVRKEGETSKSFEAALSAEKNRYNNPEFKRKCYGWHANYYYYHRGLYFEQVKRYIDLFGADNVLILLFENLKKDGVDLSQKVYRFLGVDDHFIPLIKVHNPAGGRLIIPRFWKDVGLYLKTIQFIFSYNLIKKIPHLLRNIGRTPPLPINPSTANDLREKFQDDICLLEKLIGIDLPHWKRLKHK